MKKFIWLSLLFVPFLVFAEDDKFNLSTDKPVEAFCTEQYEPVCGEINLECIKAPCPKTYETFTNKCKLINAGATFAYEGVCYVPKPTDDEVNKPDTEKPTEEKPYTLPLEETKPVEATKPGIEKPTEIKPIDKPGIVKPVDTKPTEVKPVLGDVISDKLQIRLDAWLEKIKSRVDNSRMTNEGKIERLSQLKDKLIALAKKRPKIVPAIKYLVTGIELIIDSIEGDFSDIEDILKDFL